MIDQAGLQSIRTSLEADGYAIDVREEAERIDVVISATPTACPECLVPPELMRSILEQALKVPAGDIDLTYPADEGTHGAADGSPEGAP